MRRRVWLDRQTLRPVRLRSYDERGDLRTEARLRVVDGDRPPAGGHLASPRRATRRPSRFDRVETNVPVPERAFAPRTPPEYKVVEVGK